MDMFENPNYYFNESQYKSKFICVDCRKVFKRPILKDISKEETLETEPKCPDCGAMTYWIGPKFRAPKLDKIKAWNSVKVLLDIGVLNFLGYANNPMTIPETTKGLKELLLLMKETCNWTIKKWTTYEYSSDNKNQIKYFSDRIKAIDKHLETL